MRSRSKVRQVAIRLVCALVFTGFGLPGSAMGAEDFPPAVGVADRAEILTWICETLSARYVEPEVARAMVDEVRARAAAGAYDTLDAADAFLLALEQDLRAASNDKHLGLWLEHLEDVKDDDTDYTPADPTYVENLRRTNYGFKKIEISVVAREEQPPHFATILAVAESPPLQEAYQKDPKVKELIDVSRRLEGTTRHASTHAAGVVISPSRSPTWCRSSRETPRT